MAFNTANGQIEAVGLEAHEMLGRTPPNIKAIRPMKDGVIADFDAAEKMLTHFIKKAHGKRAFVRPRLVIGAIRCRRFYVDGVKRVTSVRVLVAARPANAADAASRWGTLLAASHRARSPGALMAVPHSTPGASVALDSSAGNASQGDSSSVEFDWAAAS